MAALIQISRGIIERYQNGEEPLPQGTLFWKPRNLYEKTDDVNNPGQLPYNEGTLFIGDPSCDGVSQPIAIGGYRSSFSLMFKGYVEDLKTHAGDIVENVDHPGFKHAKVGDFWRFKSTPTSGVFHDVDDFRKEDLILITGVTEEEIDFEKTGVTYASSYIRIAAGRYAEDIEFNNIEPSTNFDAVQVDEALRELETEKISYRGSIGTSAELNTLQTSANLHIGTMYLVTADDIVFNNGLGTQWTSKKGDFAVWTANITRDNTLNAPDKYNPKYAARCYWVRIPSGYTDSSDIDYLQYNSQKDDMQKKLESVKTFLPSHITEAIQSKNVQLALDFLFTKKAQLDEHGKVPLSQLHDTVLGSLQYKGVWSPIKENVVSPGDGTKDYLNDVNNQSPWPVDHGDEFYDGVDGRPKSAPSNGDYYVVQIPKEHGGTNTYLNVQYVDKSTLDPITGLYSRTIELNTGDWIVYQASNDELNSDGNDGHNGRWEKIDNTDRLASIGFHINGIVRPAQNNETELEEVISKKVELLGSPSIKASHKLCIYEDVESNTVTVGGVRLVDQRWDENDSFRSRHTYLPKYYGTDNTLENTQIKDVPTDSGINLTTFESNVSIGENELRRTATVFGEFILKRSLTNKDMNQYDNTYLTFDFQSNAILGSDQNKFVKSVLKPSDNLQTESEVIITLPEKTSTLIGKLDGINLVSNYIPKTDIDGYIRDSSIYEHTLPDGRSISVEFKSGKIASNKVVVRELVIGKTSQNSKEFPHGDLPGNELNSKIVSNSQTENIEVILPAESSTLLTLKNYREVITKKAIKKSFAVFSDSVIVPGVDNEPIVSLEGAVSMKTTQAILLDNLLSRKTTGTSGISSPTPSIIVEEENRLLESIYKKSDDDHSKDDIIIDADVIVGEILNNVTDSKDGVFGKTRSLKVSKSIILGNNDTANCHFVPGRSQQFKDASQYRDAYTQTDVYEGDLLPEIEVFVSPPAESGIMLTSNSRIDGKLWI